MADLNTAQKAHLTVKDTFGNTLGSGFTATVVGDAVSVSMTGGLFVVGLKAGTADVTIDHVSGAQGTITVTVEPAPLAITLDAPVAK
jgi:hypothetical protein